MRLKYFAAVVALLLGTALQAQTTTSTLEGGVVGGDNAGLPGATVTATSPGLAEPRVTTTDANGGYSFADLPPGLYTVMAELEGSKTVERSGIPVQLHRGGRADFVLLADAAEDAIVINSVSNAATSLPSTVTNSEIPRGGIVILWGQNIGPAAIVFNQTIPLPTVLGDGRAYIEVPGGERFELFPLYASGRQSAFVVPSNTPAGEGKLVLERGGQMSNPFRVHVVDNQPGIFTLNQTGQGAGVVTRPDFSLVTPQKPAKPGEFVILWGTGLGPGPFDDRPGAFDKRDSLLNYKFGFGGLEINYENIHYIGSGGAIAVDQFTVKMPGGSVLAPSQAEAGCGLPFRMFGSTDTPRQDAKSSSREARTAETRKAPFSPTISIPYSVDGSTCEDPHGNSSEQVDKIFDGGLNQVVARVTEIRNFDGELQQELVGVEALGQLVTASTFNPPFPMGTCGSRWLAEGAEDTFAPQRVELDGSIEFTVPWATFTLNKDSNFGPFRGLYARPDPDAIVDTGTFRLTANDLKFGNTANILDRTGDYSRGAAALADEVRQEILDIYRDTGHLTLFDVMEVVFGSGRGNSETLFGFHLRRNGGPRGTNIMDCFSPTDPEDYPRLLESLVEQSREILHTEFTGPSEGGRVTVRFFGLNADRSPGGPGIDDIEVFFDAEMNFELSYQAIDSLF